MALPLVISAGDAGHIGDHEELHALVADAVTPFVLALSAQDVFANRPAAGVQGRFYHATDTQQLFFDTGSGWESITEYLGDFNLNFLSSAATISGFRIPACRVGRTTARTIVTGTTFSSGIGWDNEAGGQFYDNDALHSITVTTDRLTASREGVWQVGAQIRWDTNGTGQRGIRIRKFPDDVNVRKEDRAASSGEDYQGIISDVELESGDWCEIQVFQTSGGNLDILAAESFAFMHFITDEA
jgi:hypothetical protein